MKITVSPLDLQLKREFVIATGRVKNKRNLIVVIEDIGIGEASGSVFYGANAGQIETELKVVADLADDLPLEAWPHFWEEHGGKLSSASRCALSTAWYDYRAKKDNISLAEIMEFPEAKRCRTSLTVSIGDTGAIPEAANCGFKTVKIKLDNNTEIFESTHKALSEHPEIAIRVDANGSWDMETARKFLDVFSDLKIELLEQPFKPENEPDWLKLKDMTDIPVIMDESVATAEDVARAADLADGVNIKLQKSGTLETAAGAINKAHELNMKTMLGCMIESSVGIATSWQFSEAVDFLDLDGRLLIVDDPFEGLVYDKGELYVEDNKGHGISFA